MTALVQTTPDEAPGAAGVPVAHLVEVLEAELRELAGMADGLQDALAASALGGNFSAERFLTEAQGLDFMVQRLQSLAAFLNRMAPGMPAGWTVDPTSAARSLTLSSLSDRLCGPANAPAAEPTEAGSFHLF